MKGYAAIGFVVDITDEETKDGVRRHFKGCLGFIPVMDTPELVRQEFGDVEVLEMDLEKPSLHT